MKRFLFVCASLLVLTACLSPQQRANVEAAGEAIASTAPFLPPPFGVLAGGLAAILTGVASVGANKASNEAYKKEKDAPLLVKLATDHSSTIMGVIAVLVPALRAAGVIHFSDAELSVLLATFAVPVGTKKVMRRKA